MPVTLPPDPLEKMPATLSPDLPEEMPPALSPVSYTHLTLPTKA